MSLVTLHLTNAYHGESGGIRTLYHALLAEAERTGRRMTLVVPGKRSSVERLGTSTRIIQIASPPSPIVDRRYRLILPHCYFPLDRSVLGRIVREERPDVIEICDKYLLPYVAGLMRRQRRRGKATPSLVGLSCERMDDNLEAYLGPFGRHVARRFVGGAYVGMFDAHIANSQYTADELRDSMRPRHQRPVFVCCMGVDPVPASPETIAQTRRDLLRRTGVAEANLILYAGRVSPEKHVDRLPSVLGLLEQSPRPAHLFIAGDGPQRDAVMRAAALLAPGRVHWIGHVNDKGALAALVSAADVFVHPNPREPFGIGPLEAMALGVPLVAPSSGGVLTYASRQTAWLASPGIPALAKTLQDCLNNPHERMRRALKGKLVARQYSWTRAAARLFETYERVHAMRTSAVERCHGGDSCVLPHSPLSEHLPLR